MAADKHSPNRARTRKRRRHLVPHTPTPRQGRSTRRRIAHRKRVPRKAPEATALKEQMEDRIRGLTNAMSAIVVAVAALRRQNCDIDEDIARVLERSAADRLDIEIEQLATLTGVDRDIPRVRHSEGTQS